MDELHKISLKERVIKWYLEGPYEDEVARAAAEEFYEEALKIGMELDNVYHTREERRVLFQRLIDREVDDTFRFVPPFYTDFGKNIRIGRNVFINSG